MQGNLLSFQHCIPICHCVQAPCLPVPAKGLIKRSDSQAFHPARLCRRYYEAVARLLRQGFPRMREEQTAVCALLSQIPEEELEALCRRSGTESAS